MRRLSLVCTEHGEGGGGRLGFLASITSMDVDFILLSFAQPIILHEQDGLSNVLLLTEAEEPVTT